MKSDPKEENDLKDKFPDIAKNLSNQIKEWEQDKIRWKWDEADGWPEVTDTIHIDLMNNRSWDELIFSPGQKRKTK